MQEEKKPDVKKKRTVFQKIVNVFLYIFLGIFLLLLLVFGITQTASFREYLRTTVIEQANENLNGTVYIEKIDGTIFTSLILRKTVVNMGVDTLLYAEKIEIRTSPLQLLLKKIKVRKIEIFNATISLVTDRSGKLNIAKLFPTTPEDTSKSSFPFRIQINNFSLRDVNFYMHRYDRVGSKTLYDILDLDDLRVEDINLKLDAFADIDHNNFEVNLEKLSFKPNINNFNMETLSGEFAVNPEQMFANNLVIKTENSEIELKAQSRGYNLFDSTADFSTALLDLRFESDKFNFKDISPFVTSLEILKGDIAFKLHSQGTLKELNLDLLEIDIGDSHLKTSGMVSNIDEPDRMYIKADFQNSYINQWDVHNLLPGLEIPVYKEYGLLKLDTLKFYGKPQNFNIVLNLLTDRGNLLTHAALNFEREELVYDVKLVTSNFDLMPVSSSPIILNSHIFAAGVGTSPEVMTAHVKINAGGSSYDNLRFENFQFSADAENKIINYSLSAVSDTMGVDLNGSVDFTSNDDPLYNLDGVIRNLNIQSFTGDTSLNTNLNLNITAEGGSFDLDSINLYTSIFLKNSTLNGILIDSTRAIADLRRDEGGGRVINLISDLADITVTGNFQISQMIKVISNEIELITKIAKEKANEIIPESATITVTDSIIKPILRANTEALVQMDSTTNLEYLVEFKDFALLSLFLGNAQIELDGEMSGNIKSTPDSISILYVADIAYIKYRGTDDVFFLSNLDLSLEINNSHHSQRLEDISAGLHIKTDRIFTGGDIHDFSLDLEMKNKFADLNFSAIMENSSVKLLGGIDLRSNAVKLLLDTVNINYKSFVLMNKQKIDIEYYNDEINFNSFVLGRESASLTIDGKWSRYGNSDLNVTVAGLRGKDLSTSLLDLRPESALESAIGLNFNMTGKMSSPVIKADLIIDSVTYKNKNFGKLTGNFAYNNKNMNVKIAFQDSLLNPSAAALRIDGNIPMNLDLQNGGEMFGDGSMNIKFVADNFNLAAFGDILPVVNKLNGNLIADVTLTGTPSNIMPTGFLNMEKGSFVVEANNLEYNSELKININNENITLENFMLQNIEGTENGGKLTGSGTARLSNYNIVSSDFNVSGELKVLSDASKQTSPAVYGDLVIATNGNVEFKMNEDGSFLKAPIIVKRARLTFPPTQSAYENANSKFVYKYLIDTTLGRKTNMDFESLVNYSKGNVKKSSPDKQSYFDYSIDVTLQDEATIIFVLSREFNQNLTAVLKGNITYESIAGRQNAQGELTLMEGSTLEFIKTLEAEGTIKFENEISNPNLNITATYTDYYYPADSTASIQEVEVAVKIKVTGPLKDLNKNFIKEEHNIAVYYGAENIENNTPDPTKDASDAAMFLVFGKFASDVTPQDKSASAGLTGQATSLAGSLLGGFLNNHLGNYVKSVELRRVGSSTKFNLSGRVNKFRYSVGGTTDVFQDLSQANIRIEYPFTTKLLLRLERKQAITETTSSNEMINELGLKYKFEF